MTLTWSRGLQIRIARPLRGLALADGRRHRIPAGSRVGRPLRLPGSVQIALIGRDTRSRLRSRHAITIARITRTLKLRFPLGFGGGARARRIGHRAGARMLALIDRLSVCCRDHRQQDQQGSPQHPFPPKWWPARPDGRHSSRGTPSASAEGPLGSCPGSRSAASRAVPSQPL